MGAQVLLQQGSGPEGSRQSIASGLVADGRERGSGRNHPDLTQPIRSGDRTLRVMRIVLEWLGLVRPDPARKEPAVLPASAPYVVAAVIALTATGLAAFLRLIIGAMV